MIHIPGPLPPVITHTSDKTFGTAGGERVEVPFGTELSELYSDSNNVPLSREGSPLQEECLWKVTGSMNTVYLVKRDIHLTYSCTCLGFRYRKRCRHIDSVKHQQE